MTITRREFMGKAAIGVAGTTLANALRADERQTHEELLPIVDTHQHLWDMNVLNPPWLKGAPDILRCPYVTRDYLDAVEGLNVVKAIYMEIDLSPSQHRAEAEHVIGLCRSPDHPTVAAVISGRPENDDFADYIQPFSGSPYVKGIRRILQGGGTPRGHCLQPAFVRSLRLLGDLGMSFDICMRVGELADAVQLVDQCPNTRFVLDHCGNADPKAFLSERARQGRPASHDVDQWRRDIGALAERDHVICKISGIVARVVPDAWDAGWLAPVINHCLDSFGPDRVVFGGDWPVCLRGATYRQWVEALKQVISNRPQEDQKKLLHDNAIRFYRLS